MKIQENYIHIDYSPSDDCINDDSFGCICVKCGCCKLNPNYRDMIRRRIKYYKSKLAEQYTFDNWSDSDHWKKIQKRNIQSNIRYFKQRIRICKKIMRTMKGSGT